MNVPKLAYLSWSLAKAKTKVPDITGKGLQYIGVGGPRSCNCNLHSVINLSRLLEEPSGKN